MSKMHRQIMGIPKWVRRLRRRARQQPAAVADAGCDPRFRFLPRLSEKLVSRFEREHDLALPEDYRYFLTHVGNGGAGPGYGLYPLPVGKRPKKLPQFGSRNLLTGEPYLPEVGDLTKPFPWTSAVTLGEDWEEERWDEQPGVIVLAPQGCCYFWFLVVRGPAYGTVWEDSSPATEMLEPTGETFLGWYRRWLAEMVDSLDAQPSWRWLPWLRRDDAEYGGMAFCPECRRLNQAGTRICPRCDTRMPRRTRKA